MATVKKDFIRPGDKVTVVHLGLNYPGLVNAVVENIGGLFTYRVEYAENGTIKQGEFRHNELDHA